MLRRIGICFLFLCLTGCGGLHMTPGIGRPWSFNANPPPGPPEYQQGWSDGCESAFSGYGNQFAKAFHSLRKDGAYTENPVYQRVWRDAYDYCRAYMKATQLHGYGNYNSWYE